jgi:WD40 repeat protein
VNWLAFSRDGATLFSGGQDKIVKRWSFPGLKELARATMQDPVRGLGVHPTEGWVLCAGEQRDVHLAADTLRPLGPSCAVCCPRACFSADGRFVLTHFREHVQVMDVRTERQIQKLSPPAEVLTHERDVCSLALSPDGALILSASEGKLVRLWERASGRLLAELPADGERPQAIFHPDGRSLALAAGKQVRFFPIGGLREQTFAGARPYPVVACALHPDGRHLACLSQSGAPGLGEATVWRLGTRQSTPLLAAWSLAGSSGDEPLPLAFQPSDLTLACTLPGPSSLVFLGLPGQSTAQPGGQALAFSPDGQLWTAGGGDVQRREVAGGRVAAEWSSSRVRMLTGASDPIALAAGRRWVAAGANNGFVYLLNAATASSAGLFRVADTPVRSVAINAGESLVAAGTDRGELRLLAVPGGEIVTKEKPHRDRVTALSFAGNGLLASGSRDRTVRLWRCRGGALEERMTLPMPGPVRWLAFHADGVRLFVLIDGERAVRVWHLDRLRARLDELGLGADLDGIDRVELPPAVVPPALPSPPVEAPKGANGLRAELFTDLDLRHAVKVRYDGQINFTWSGNGLDPQRPKERFSVRWSGWLKAPRQGRYVLRLDSAGPARLWLDDQLRIDCREKGGWKQDVEIELSDRPLALRVEYFHLTGGAGVCLSWEQTGGFSREPIPSWALFHERAAAERAVLPSR